MVMEKAVALHSSTFAWKIPRTEEPGGLKSMGSQRVGHGWATSTFTFHFHALEKEMASHSIVLAWRIPGTGEAGGLPSMGSHRVGHDWSDLAAAAAVSLVYFKTPIEILSCRFIKFLIPFYNTHTIKCTHFKHTDWWILTNIYIHMITTSPIKIKNISVTSKGYFTPCSSLLSPAIETTLLSFFLFTF